MEQRRTRRFKLQLPLEITRTGADRVAAIGLTRNISSTGVLFTAEREPDLGGPIEYIITLNHEGTQAVEPALHREGVALRAHRERAGRSAGLPDSRDPGAVRVRPRALRLTQESLHVVGRRDVARALFGLRRPDDSRGCHLAAANLRRQEWATKAPRPNFHAIARFGVSAPCRPAAKLFLRPDAVLAF